MADVKISLLTDATTVGGTDEFPIVQGGVTKRATVSELKTGLALTKSDVGLGNVDNTSDANKPVSTATTTALAGKSDTSHTHLLAAGATDVTMTAANLNTLDDGVNTTLHFHDSDRSRANHTGTQTASTISDFNSATRAQVEAELIAGTNVTITPGSSGATRTLTIDAAGGGSAITVQDEGTPLTTAATTLNFTGAGVTATGTGATKTIDIPGAGSATITVKENGTNVSTAITALDFLGADFDVTESPAGEANVVVAAAIARLASPTFTGTPAAPTAAAATNTTQIATTAMVQSAITAAAQPLDSDLTAIAALTPTNDDIVQRKSGAWTNRTMAQLNTDLLAVAPTVVVDATTARTLAASDNGKIIRFTSASAVTVTVPTAFSGFGCTIIRAGTGIVTLAASSTTLNGGSLVLNGQYLAASILPTGTANTFDIIGATGGVDKLDATSNPTTGDDSANGYGVGSKWVNLTADTVYFCTDASVGTANWVLATGGAGVSDGDKGDITVSGSGATYTIDNGVVSLAKMANLAQDQVIGRVTASTGVPETFTVTAAARTVLDDTTTGAMLTTLSAAARSQTACGISFSIPTVANQDYIIVLKAPHAGTITETTSKCTSGTATATFKVNTTALGGTANSVSSTEQSQARSTSNTFAADDDIVVTMSANSSCVGAVFTIKYTRTLA